MQALTRRPKEWVDFMMRFELGLEEPDPKRAHAERGDHRRIVHRGRHYSRFTLHGFAFRRTALLWSVVVTLIALGVFGYIKGRFTGARAVRSASQTIVIGGLAAGAAFLIARLIS